LGCRNAVLPPPDATHLEVLGMNQIPGVGNPVKVHLNQVQV